MFDSSAKGDEPAENVNSEANFALEFGGAECVLVPALTCEGRHRITLESTARPYRRTDDYTRSTVVGNLQLSGLGIHYNHGRLKFNYNDDRQLRLGYASAGDGSGPDGDGTVNVMGAGSR